MKVASSNVARPSMRRYEGLEVSAGGTERPAPRWASVTSTARERSTTADRKGAACVYPLGHYAHWERTLRELSLGRFGENLTASGALETEVFVGDVFRVGGAIVQVSQPRVPCGELAAKMVGRLLARWMTRTGYAGYYAEVLSEGTVSAGDAFERVGWHPDRISITDGNDVYYGRSKALALVERLAGTPEPGASGRTAFAGRLERPGRGPDTG